MNKKLTITIEMNNAAFDDEPLAEAEYCIFKAIQKMRKYGRENMKYPYSESVHDSNGNKVGMVKYEMVEEEETE